MKDDLQKGYYKKDGLGITKWAILFIYYLCTVLVNSAEIGSCIFTM